MLKYCLAPILLSALLICDWLGPQAVWCFFFGFSAFVIIGDQILTNDHSQFRIGNTKLNFILYLILPLLLLKLFNMTLIGMGDHGSIIFMILADEALFKVWDRVYSGFDLFGIILTSGLFLGGIGTVAGHELVHRKKHSFGFKVSNWLLALTWDPAFGIEHVHGHHKYVATYQDPETARRDEGVYSFIIRSTASTLKNAWKWESERLAQLGLRPVSFQNQMFQIYLRSIILTAAISLGGTMSLIVYFGSVLWAKIMLETVNYLEHYGLVRVPGTAIEPKHSWNSNHMVSSTLLFNLTRHSAHHEKSNLPFWKLEPYKDAPMLPNGYLSMLYFILLLPWKYRKIMEHKLADWDAKYASEQELELIKSMAK